MHRTRARLAATGAALALALPLAIACALAIAVPASAHNYYTSSTPGMNEVLTSLPVEFVVATNDKLLELGDSAGGFFMEVTGPDGLYYGDGCIAVSGASVSMAAAAGPVGKYSLDWQVISADGHTVSGQIPFTWQPLTPPEIPSRGSAAPPKCGESPEPVVTQTPEATETPGASTETEMPTNAEDATNSSDIDILWIAGGIGAAAVAVIAAILLIRPKKKA